MFDDAQRLRDNPRVLDLLAHYATLGAAGRDVWQDRLMHMDGVEPRELSKFHGELIAFDWIEQNTGQTFLLKEGTVPSCYRITLNGLRDLGRIQGVEITLPFREASEKKGPRLPRRKKQKSDAQPILTLVPAP